MIIWKFPLEITDEQVVRFPANHQIIGVANVNNQLVLYSLVDETMSELTLPTTIRIYGTGRPIDPTNICAARRWTSMLTYIGSVVIPSEVGTDMVWHVFEEQKLPVKRG